MGNRTPLRINTSQRQNEKKEENIPNKNGILFERKREGEKKSKRRNWRLNKKILYVW